MAPAAAVCYSFVLVFALSFVSLANSASGYYASAKVEVTLFHLHTKSLLYNAFIQHKFNKHVVFAPRFRHCHVAFRSLSASTDICYSNDTAYIERSCMYLTHIIFIIWLLFALLISQSCSGCSLNRLPHIKQFIFEDLPQ